MFSVPRSPVQNNREAWHGLVGFISAMRITMLLFHPVSYRVGHHRHHRSTSLLYGAPSYSIHVTLLHSPSRFALVASPVLRIENFNCPRPLHNFHWIQFLSRANNNERAARVRRTWSSMRRTMRFLLPAHAIRTVCIPRRLPIAVVSIIVPVPCPLEMTAIPFRSASIRVPGWNAKFFYRATYRACWWSTM